MAPTRAQESSGDYETEYNDFVEKLKAYHEKRGTHLEIEPRVGTKQIDLLQLFRVVVDKGGYDRISDEKLAWRKLGAEFNLGANNLPALAFALKSVYYRNLAAYEISTIHGKEPPPKEILEETTAKGGNLLNRTLENYLPASRRDQSEGSGEDGTPDRNRHDSEETPGSGGRVTRGLRQAPPQRVLFQPDTLPARQTRQMGQMSTASPSQPSRASSTHNPVGSESMSSAVANYEPRPPMPLTLRPVMTPGNNFAEFTKRHRMIKEQEQLQMQAQSGVPQLNPRIMLPGTGFEGPNIYVRCLLALKSGIKEEQDYALHHLVKISFERGDKFKFESFPGLAETLIDKALEIGSLFYEVNWEVAYPEDGINHGKDLLDGVYGTPDLVTKIADLTPKDVDDNLMPKFFSDNMLQIVEAVLTLRNMIMLEENSSYLSEMMPFRDLLVIILNLPKLECVVEVKHYALDIAEQITKYIGFESEDPLYISLIKQLDTDDRGAIISTLHALGRISLNLEESNRLENIPSRLLQYIIDWMLLDDDELIEACLDFLYAYTAVVPNVNRMVNEVNLFHLATQLSILLTHGGKKATEEITVKREYRRPAPVDILQLPHELLEKLYDMDEPERSSCWLRMLFEEDKDEYITQIQIWQAYQKVFTPAQHAGKTAMLVAGEFIKNVSATFADRVTAQVHPDEGKYILKGIRIREAPIDMKGREYTKCRWTFNPNITGYSECREFFMTSQQLWHHIMVSHLSCPTNEEGQIVNIDRSFSCDWAGCTKFRTLTPLKSVDMGAHIKLHVMRAIAATAAKNPSGTTTDLTVSSASSNPASSLDALLFPSNPPSTRRNARPAWIEPPVTKQIEYISIPTDEQGDPVGIPYSSALVLRNLARNLPKTDSEEQGLEARNGVTLVQATFEPLKPKFWYLFAHCRPLMPYLSDLLTVYSE